MQLGLHPDTPDAAQEALKIVCRKMLTYADVCRKMLLLELYPDTPDTDARQALRNGNRYLTLYLNVWHDADANANGLMQCERHRRTVIIFTIFLPLVLSV